MNKTYYKGDIKSLSTFNRDMTRWIGCFYKHDYYSSSKVELDNWFETVSKNELYKLKNILLSNLKNSEEVNLTSNLFSAIKYAISFEKNYKHNIIFELIHDESGVYYGKEILTGLIFPIFDIKNKKIIKTSEKIYITFYKSHTWGTLYDLYYNLNTDINFEKMDKCEAIIYNYKVADINEINEYLEIKKHKKQLKKEINIITELANKNVYNTEIVPAYKKEVKREKQDDMTIMMENIEFLLEKLGTVNGELKDKYEKEYELLLNSEEEVLTNNPLTKISLSRLEGKIEYAISYSKSSSPDIVSYLENLKKEYLNNFISNSENKTDMTLKELDKLNELFLKMKSSYNLKVQREVLRNISFVYLMEIYENINNISKEDLEDSYFIDNKKSIIIAIESLIKSGLIEDNLMIDYNSNFTAEEMLNIISKIKFKRITENKGITRKLEK